MRFGEEKGYERHGAEVLGERLAWARTQQGMTLEDVHMKTGLAIGYICQLESGSKANPTLNALTQLARALYVPVSFLVGEVDEPGATEGGMGTVARTFAQWLHGLPRERQANIKMMTVEQRFTMVVKFLCERFPMRFTRASIAFQIGLTVRSLNDVLEQSWELKPFTLTQFCQLTGLGMQFFAAGELDAVQEEITTADLLRYVRAIRLASARQVEPAELERLIREHS